MSKAEAATMLPIKIFNAGEHIIQANFFLVRDAKSPGKYLDAVKSSLEMVQGDITDALAEIAKMEKEV